MASHFAEWLRHGEGCANVGRDDTRQPPAVPIPPRLKLYLDTIVQPDLTFAYDPESGYSGLVGDKPVMVLATRGGDYCPESGASDLDLQMPYLKLILGSVALTNVESVIAQPLDAAPPEEAEKTLATAIQQARRAGKHF